jgi:DNA-binding response OmpR family regulator
MKESILNHKKLLIVDDEPDVLQILEEEILSSCPDSKIDKATTFESASELLKSRDYDLVILDIMGVRGFDLLDIAVAEKLKVVMLTAHALNPKSFMKSHDMGAMSYLPKDKLGEIVPFLEEALRYDRKSLWKRLMERHEELYTEDFKSIDWKTLGWY